MRALIVYIVLIITLVSTFSLKTFAQRVTLSDLKYVLYHDLAVNDDYLIKKGFNHAGISDYEGGGESYKYSKNRSDSKEYLSISKDVYNDISYQSSYYTVLQSDYVFFKNQVKSAGFILTNTSRNDQSTIYTFEKGNLAVRCWVTNTKYGFPDYYIVLVDKTLETQYLNAKSVK